MVIKSNEKGGEYAGTKKSEIKGKPWDQMSLIIAALVRRYGGKVELKADELKESGGMIIRVSDDRSIITITTQEGQ